MVLPARKHCSYFDSVEHHYTVFSGFPGLNIQKLNCFQTFSVLIAFSKIKQHPVYDLGTTALSLHSWLCRICLGNSYFSPFSM